MFINNKKKYGKMLLFSYLLILTFLMGAKKNHLIETVLLSTHNICFGGLSESIFSIMHSYLEIF